MYRDCFKFRKQNANLQFWRENFSLYRTTVIQALLLELRFFFANWKKKWFRFNFAQRKGRSNALDILQNWAKMSNWFEKNPLGMYTYKMQNCWIEQVRQLCFSSQFQHVVNLLCFFLQRLHDRSKTLPFELWDLGPSSATFQSEVNFQCLRASLYLSFLWFFNPIIFVYSIFLKKPR